MCAWVCAGGFSPAWQLIFNSEAPPSATSSKKITGTCGADSSPFIFSRSAGSGLKAPRLISAVLSPLQACPAPLRDISAPGGCNSTLPRSESDCSGHGKSRGCVSGWPRPPYVGWRGMWGQQGPQNLSGPLSPTLRKEASAQQGRVDACGGL